MVAEPGLEIVVTRHGGPGAPPAPAGGTPLAERAAGFAEKVRAASGGPPARVEVRRAAPEHAGLGTGTQLGMAVARAMAEIAGEKEPSARELAIRSGRGQRSGVGLHGFLAGGLIVDGGKADPEVPAPLVARLEIPADWRFVIFLPRGGSGGAAPSGSPLSRGLSGEVEREAFRRLERAPALAAEMASAVLLGLLPAAAEADLQAFQEALAEIERRTGECFAPVQGGAYAAPELEEVVRFLAREGAPGSGQSSWGPALYAVVSDGDRGADLARRVISAFPRLELQTIVSPPLNRGAQVDPVPPGQR
jgi:beta-RFAP synthase